MEKETLNKVAVPFKAGKKEYEIQCDANSWSIAKVFKDKKGERKTTGIKFFTNLDGALQRALEMKVKGTPASTLEELLYAISRAKEEIIYMYAMTVDTDDLDEAVGE